jgi:general secretion pathway protein M
LTKRQRQLLALAILALVIAIMVTLTVVPLWAANRHYHNTIDGLDGRLEILQRTTTAGNGLRSQHEQLKQSLASNRHYLKSASEALAAADLQGIIKHITGTKGMEVLSTQILPATEESNFTRVALKVRMRGKLGNLLKMFHSLETGQPYLFLDHVSIRSRGQRRRNVNADQLLDVDFDLIGYMPRPS